LASCLFCAIRTVHAVMLNIDGSEIQANTASTAGLQVASLAGQPAEPPVSVEEVTQALNNMRNAPSDPKIIEAGCNIIHGRGYTDPNKDWFLDIKGLEPVIEALESFPVVKGVQLACSQAVASMSLYNKRTMEAAGEGGVVELLVNIMRRWPEDPQMQIGGASGCFMDYSSANRARWASEGGIEVNMASIVRFFDNPEAVLQGWFAFSSGAQPPNTERFAEAGGIELAIRTMRAHAKSYRVREEVMQAMRQVGKISDLSLRAVNKGWLEEVMKALKDAPSDMHQQSVGCANLAVYSGRNASFREKAVRLGAADVALEALRAFPKMISPASWPKSFETQYTVREDCVDCLAQLSLDLEGAKMLREAQVTSEISMLLWQHPLNTRLQTSGGVLLSKLKS